MAVEIRPTYESKLRYALKVSCVFWLFLPAWLVAAYLSINTYRWVTFEVVAVGGAVLTVLCAPLWAARSADLPQPQTTWREILRLSAIFNAVFIAIAALPYFRYTYVHVGTTVVRVDRLTNAQCRFPKVGCESAPYDPIMHYDAKTGAWTFAPGSETVRDWISRQ